MVGHWKSDQTFQIYASHKHQGHLHSLQGYVAVEESGGDFKSFVMCVTSTELYIWLSAGSHNIINFDIW